MKFSKDLASRMKEYEYVTRYKLIPHMPTIIRLDRKCFHNFTKDLKKPFDEKLHQRLCYAMEELMKNEVQNSVFGYTQSDEISILLKDFPNLNTEQWFNGNIQKICSVSASALTVYFNEMFYSDDMFPEEDKFAFFDCRVFQLPYNEVINYFIWRQQDATKNSIQSLARSHYSHKELQNKNSKDLQNLLLKEKNINWNDLEVWKKRGSSCYRIDSGKYIIDDTPDIFSKNRDFINKHINLNLN